MESTLNSRNLGRAFEMQLSNESTQTGTDLGQYNVRNVLIDFYSLS